MGNLIQNLNEIYTTKLQIKNVIGTESDVFSEYPQLIEEAMSSGLSWDDVAGYGYIVPTGTYNVTANGTYSVSAYSNVEVDVPIDWSEVATYGYVVPAGTYNITANGTYSVSSYENVAVDVPIPSGYVYPNQIVSLDHNGRWENAKMWADVTVACPVDSWDAVASYGYIVPAGTYTIGENGSNIDVSTYQYVTVNVSGGGASNTFTIDSAIYDTPVADTKYKLLVGNNEYWFWEPLVGIQQGAHLSNISATYLYGNGDTKNIIVNSYEYAGRFEPSVNLATYYVSYVEGERTYAVDSNNLNLTCKNYALETTVGTYSVCQDLWQQFSTYLNNMNVGDRLFINVIQNGHGIIDFTTPTPTTPTITVNNDNTFTLSTPDTGAKIYYTIDDSTFTNSYLYSNAVSFNSNCTAYFKSEYWGAYSTVGSYALTAADPSLVGVKYVKAGSSDTLAAGDRLVIIDSGDAYYWNGGTGTSSASSASGMISNGEIDNGTLANPTYVGFDANELTLEDAGNNEFYLYNASSEKYLVRGTQAGTSIQIGLSTVPEAFSITNNGNSWTITNSNLSNKPLSKSTSSNYFRWSSGSGSVNLYIRTTTDLTPPASVNAPSFTDNGDNTFTLTQNDSGAVITYAFDDSTMANPSTATSGSPISFSQDCTVYYKATILGVDSVVTSQSLTYSTGVSLKYVKLESGDTLSTGDKFVILDSSDGTIWNLAESSSNRTSVSPVSGELDGGTTTNPTYGTCEVELVEDNGSQYLKNSTTGEYLNYSSSQYYYYDWTNSMSSPLVNLTLDGSNSVISFTMNNGQTRYIYIRTNGSSPCFSTGSNSSGAVVSIYKKVVGDNSNSGSGIETSGQEPGGYESPGWE